jgi:hypothetical protein
VNDAVLGGLIAFGFAALAVGTDAQSEMRSRFGGRHGTFAPSTGPGLVFIIWWSLVDLAFYIWFLKHHDWAKRAFNVDVEKGTILTGLAVGVSAVLIIRTKLATYNSIPVGFDAFYEWTRSILIDQLNRKRVRMRRTFLGKFKAPCNDIEGLPKYFTSAEKTLKELAAGKAQQAEIQSVMATIRSSVGEPDRSSVAREDLTGLFYDYFGPEEVEKWATDTDHGQK